MSTPAPDVAGLNKGIIVPPIEAIPLELRGIAQFVCWRYEQRRGEPKPTKPPINPHVNGDLRHAKTNDPATWGSLDTALTAARAHGLGIGLCLWEGDGLTGIDLDHVIGPETGTLDPRAAEIIERFKGTYCETSPSGEGLRIWCYGKAQRSGKNAGSPKWLEVYTHPSNRFLTVTGQGWRGTAPSITECQDALDWLHETYMASTRAKDNPPPVDKPPPSLSLDDAEMLAMARRARNGAEFERLFSGDISGHQDDHSGADLALCSLLAFWTGRDATRIDRLFRQSGLMRAKWDSRRGEATYGQVTIEKAVAGTRETYRGGSGRAEEASGTRKPPRAPKAKGDEAPFVWAPPQATPCTIQDAIGVFQKWLYLPDPSAVYVTIGAYAANLLSGDPVWLMLVASPSSGKTEILGSLSSLPKMFMAATLTESALLSGSPKKDHAAGAKGGLLRSIGSFGYLCCKDFTSVLSQNKDSRAALLAALREIYDGSWTRHVGTDGGRTLDWKGRLGFLGGVTPAIDRHHAVIGIMGDRFLLHRLSTTKEADRERARKRMKIVGQEDLMRSELAAAVNGALAAMVVPSAGAAISLTEAQNNQIADLACLVARCRSAVDRDNFKREIDMIPDSESPTRLVVQLVMLYRGMRAAGVPAREAWKAMCKTAMDSMPAIRQIAFIALQKMGESATTTEIAGAIAHPTQTTRRALEDLAGHGMLERRARGPGKADIWCLSRWATELYASAHTFPDIPEMGESVPADSTPPPPPSTSLYRVHSVEDGKLGKGTFSASGLGPQSVSAKTEPPTERKETTRKKGSVGSVEGICATCAHGVDRAGTCPAGHFIHSAVKDCPDWRAQRKPGEEG